MGLLLLLWYCHNVLQIEALESRQRNPMGHNADDNATPASPAGPRTEVPLSTFTVFVTSRTALMCIVFPSCL